MLRYVTLDVTLNDGPSPENNQQRNDNNIVFNYNNKTKFTSQGSLFAH